MIAEAAVKGFPRLFEATGYAQYNLGIPYQQIRATALAWALISRRHASIN